MRKIIFLIVGLLWGAWSFSLKAQMLIKNSSVTGVCYAGTKIHKIYIPPPDEFLKKGISKGGGSVTVYYSSGFSILAKPAIEKAASILGTMLPADTKVTILASWEKISTAGVLGQSSITGYVGGWWINALTPMAIYPVGLAEKIAGKSYNNDLDGDITLTINSSKNWYLGTDGNTPTSRYDLVTVALHEICHGLGFFDSMSTDGTIGWYGIDSIPLIYDTFVENNEFKKLTDKLTFHNYSANLRSQYTGGLLYFDGPLLKKFTSGGRAALYAPSTWDSGSSISHLDESGTSTINSLMTPFIDLGEAIHNPGKLTFSILGDLGWINTRIIHNPLGDTEEHLSEVKLSVTIKSDTLYDHNKVGVVYSFDNFLSSNTRLLTSPGSDDNFTTTINISSYNTDLKYYFFVEDCFLRLYKSPSLSDSIQYHLYIGIDTVKPVIKHTPIDFLLETVDSLSFKATATDNIGIDSVYVEYKKNMGQSIFIGLKAGLDGTYSNILNARALLLNGGDFIQYRIFAKDSALLPNISVLPKTGFYSIKIEDIKSTVSTYSTDFTNSATDFFNIGFDILKPEGFSKFGLNTKHPYVSPENNDLSINSTAILRHPLKFTQSGLLINFKEIVLVEPGETGSLFGSTDFYDYVILEGSKNFGKTWFGLIDGYDSRMVPLWESSYNSAIVDGNSTFIGSESMLRDHSVFYHPSANISAGDTLLLRFRLYSDPFANGWGWIIEDLKINPIIDAVEETNMDAVSIFPNPGTGLINISTNKSVNKSGKPLRISIFNSAGICVIKDFTSGDSEAKIDISGYPAGLYIILVYRDDGIKTVKYSLIK
jgi:hypothetical protein